MRVRVLLGPLRDRGYDLGPDEVAEVDDTTGEYWLSNGWVVEVKEEDPDNG